MYESITTDDLCPEEMDILLKRFPRYCPEIVTLFGSDEAISRFHVRDEHLQVNYGNSIELSTKHPI